VIPVLWSGAGLVVVDKPAGVAVIPGRQAARGPGLRAELEEQLGHPVFVVHRLDRDTTGVLLFATDAVTHRAASLAFERGLPRKTYLALVSPPLPAARSLEVPLVPARRSRMRPARPGEAGKAALTELRPLETYGDVQLVEAVPLTGRTHQIRVHLAWAGAPLLVDAQYGRPDGVTAARLGLTGDEVLLSRTPLHAARLVLSGQPGLPRLDVQAPLPPDMARVLERLRQRRSNGADVPE
jgi:23S rRNA-/tRNA-specific pseudouridylate synthase